jgi:hypothetical protein
MDHPDSGTSAQLEAMGVLGAHIEPVVASAWRRLGLTLGASIACLFPLAYVALVALAAWGVGLIALKYRAASGTPSSFDSAPALLAFLAGGCLLILSLIKPLVAPPGQTAEPHYLDRRKEPLLFAFVKELASACGMPEPSRIAADCTVNCCCVLAGGIGGLFRPGFVLQVGLPLAASLRLDEFGGVLAHELAHAAQANAMRSNRVLYNVHAWFSRVVFERDEIDDRILNWLERAGALTRPILRLAQALSKLGRGALRLPMIAECAAASFFLRRMEAEADRYQARVAGSGYFDYTGSRVAISAAIALGGQPL